MFCYFSQFYSVKSQVTINIYKNISQEMNFNELSLTNSENYQCLPKQMTKSASLSQQSLLSSQILGDIEKIKKYHEVKKKQNFVKVKTACQQKPAYLQFMNRRIITNKNTQSPTHFKLLPQIQKSQLELFYKSESNLMPQNKLSPKYEPRQHVKENKDKKKISPLKLRKESSSSIFELNLQQKPRINSPQNRQKNYQIIKSYIHSPKYTGSLDQINNMKKSKYLEEEKRSNMNIIQELKETISTSSSNKCIRTIKISDFELGKNLGKGKFGNVKMARHKKTGMIFSLKIINKLMVKQDKIIDQLIKQTKLQSFLNHSHIVKLYSVFDDKQNIYLLMEFGCEGNLYEYMQKVGRIPEQLASEYMKQACEAVHQLHYHKIIHRDIKPQNIVMSFGMVKICDFGWSTQIKGTMRETFCGSPLYISPQLLKGQLYDEKVDLWALGILGYQMMTGTIPFQIETEKDLAKIITSRISYPNWMSPITISFLQQVLQKNPQNRSSVKQLLQHPFISRNG